MDAPVRKKLIIRVSIFFLGHNKTELSLTWGASADRLENNLKIESHKVVRRALQFSHKVASGEFLREAEIAGRLY